MSTEKYIIYCCNVVHNIAFCYLTVNDLALRTMSIKKTWKLYILSGGIPPPIYFGALIDRTCLKWGTKQCGGRGACRLYDANAFRYGETRILFSWQFKDKIQVWKILKNVGVFLMTLLCAVEVRFSALFMCGSLKVQYGRILVENIPDQLQLSTECDHFRTVLIWLTSVCCAAEIST